ncbi:MAG: hypothetical protein OXF55_01205 [Caldilineaceae bacterium]|nr:hypothetical protein [Caldilineaceae bacterium]
MEYQFDQEEKYYRDNHNEFVKKYPGKFIAIKGTELLHVFADPHEGIALQNSGGALVMLVTQNYPDYRYGEYTKVD